ncbi:MAG: hypothetical protein SVP52_06460 [Chloroflexota bacterium]|nr:hypothetical protein [Chloroflexota bacterium]
MGFGDHVLDVSDGDVNFSSLTTLERSGTPLGVGVHLSGTPSGVGVEAEHL